MSRLQKIFWYSLFVKLVIGTILPMTADESYYWVWSHHLQLSYFDHPPFVSWLFLLGQPFEFLGSAVRWAGIVMSHATIWVWLQILRRYLSDEQREMWLWLSLLSPLFGAGALLITPDIPLMFFWALTLWIFLAWVEDPTPKRSFLMGLSAGLGLTSKYIMVLEPFFIFLVCFFIPQWRKAVLRGWWIVILGVILGTLPVWLWNVLHSFASFKFQFHHGLGRKFYKPSWTYTYVLGQAALLFPVFIYAIRSFRRAPIWLNLLAWAPLAFFFFTSFKGHVEANWPIVSYPAVFALGVLAISRNVFRATVAFWGVAIALIFILVTTQWSPTGQPLKTREFHEFNALIEPVRPLEPVFARSYQMASKLSYELKRTVPKLKGMNRRDFYDFVDFSEPMGNRFYLIAETQDLLPQIYKDKGFEVKSKKPVTDRFEIWELERP